MSKAYKRNKQTDKSDEIKQLHAVFIKLQLCNVTFERYFSRINFDSPTPKKCMNNSELVPHLSQQPELQYSQLLHRPCSVEGYTAWQRSTDEDRMKIPFSMSLKILETLVAILRS